MDAYATEATGGGRAISLASLRRFWAMAVSVNSNWAPRGPRNRRRLSRKDTLQVRKQHLDALAITARGPSDHHPIALDLHVVSGDAQVSEEGSIADVRRPIPRVERWLRAMSDAPNRIRVRRSLFEALDMKLRKGRRIKGVANCNPRRATHDINAWWKKAKSGRESASAPCRFYPMNAVMLAIGS
jgi:hypothetical protein